MDSNARAWSCRQLPFLAMAVLWLSAVYFISRRTEIEIFTVGLGMLLLGAPMCLAGICTGTLRRRRTLSAMFRWHGWLYTLLSGRWLRTLLWMIWGLVMSFLLLLQFHVHEPVKWAVLAATIPVFAIVFSTIHRRLLREGLHVDMAVTVALAWSRWICPAILLVLYVVAMKLWGELPENVSINTAIEVHQPSETDRSASSLVREALLWLGYFDGLQAYALGRLSSTSAVSAWLLVGLFNFALLFSACLALSCFRIPRIGFVQARLAPRSGSDVFKTTAIVIFLVGLIFLFLARLDAYVSQSSHIPRIRELMQQSILLMVEKIGEGYYTPGTLEEIDGAINEANSQVAEAAEKFRQEVDSLFDSLENEAVDEFLDWYYSLPSEWGRLATLLIGGVDQLEVHLAQKVQETFGQERWYAGTHAASQRFFSAVEEARERYELGAQNILDRNRVDPQRVQHAPLGVTSTATLEDTSVPTLELGSLITI